MDEPGPTTGVDDTPLACLAGEQCPDVLAVLDDDFTARWVSPSAQQVFGHDPRRLVGTGMADFVHLEDLGPVVNGVAEAARIEGRHASVECRLRSADGRWIPSRVASRTFLHEGGTWWVLSIRPVADDDALLGRRARLQTLAQETALSCSEMRSDERSALVTILENLAAVIGAVGVAVWTCHSEEVQLSTSWSRDRHRSVPRPVAPPETLQAHGYVVHHIEDPTTGRQLVEAVEVALPGSRNEPGALVAELNQQVAQGVWDDFNADVVGVIGGLVHAAALRAESEQELLERAETDQLTGLFNSAAVKERMEQMIEESPWDSVAVVFGDLDGFKALNDRLGHRTGDAVLVAVADGLRTAAGEDAVVGRIGGDEFVAVKSMRGSSAAMNFMTRCRREVREALAPFPGVDISLGVAMSEPGDTPVDVLHRADVDMYTEKRRRYQIVADDGAPGWDLPVRTDFANPPESGPGTIESIQ